MQIENRLTFHPAVREAAVIAVPDTKYGEVVGVWIVRKSGTNPSRDEIRNWVAEGMNPQVRANHTCPRSKVNLITFSW